MKPLEIHCRNRVLYVRISTEDKGIGMRDYYLHHKNGVSFYIFRKEESIWKLVYGQLAEDIKEACIDALIVRFDNDVPELFYHQGMRQIVQISSKEDSIWHIYLNNKYIGSIQYDTFSKKFHYHIDEGTLITERNIQKYIDMIQQGSINWKK